MRFGGWNVRGLYRAGSVNGGARELEGSVQGRVS